MLPDFILATAMVVLVVFVATGGFDWLMVDLFWVELLRRSKMK